MFKTKKQQKQNIVQKATGKMKKSLNGSIFRMINEDLYKNDSVTSAKSFQENPELFQIYHQGFNEQKQQWKYNPIELIKELIDIEIKVQKDKIQINTLKIADVGCGEAWLMKQYANNQYIVVDSFDLVSLVSGVIEKNMTKLDITDKYDIMVYCLSLMCTDQRKALQEAYKALKVNGKMIIAEIGSRRLQNINFEQEVESIGFQCTQKKDYNYFFIDVFEKTEIMQYSRQPNKQQPCQLLGPCLYKRR